MQQEDAAATKATKNATKATKLDKICQILTQNQSKPTKKFAF